MKKLLFFCSINVLILIIACSPNGRYDYEVVIPEFIFPQSVVFEQNLSSYKIFRGKVSNLNPSDDFHLYELSSTLFTDYAYKQRLIKLPEGSQMTRLVDGTLDFPDGTILTKTFYYYNDERDTSLGKRIIETRLEIKDSNQWNLATFLWNDDQTEAHLVEDGVETQVSWVNKDGGTLSTFYKVPSQNDCMTCHQSNMTLSPLGPTLRNLNRQVIREGNYINQLGHLQSNGVLSDFDLGLISTIVDYSDLNVPLNERARSYLEMNCAHCHNPSGWEFVTEREFDYRYEIPFEDTGILYERDKIKRALLEGDMPFIGTSIIDEEGVNLIIEFIETL